MDIDVPVILSALFFTIIAIIVASTLLAKKPEQKKDQKQKQHEERSERVTAHQQPREERPSPAPVPAPAAAPVQELVTEKKREEPAPVAPVVEAEVIAVKQTPVQVRCALGLFCAVFNLVCCLESVLKENDTPSYQLNVL